MARYFVLHQTEDGIQISEYNKKVLDNLLTWDEEENSIRMKQENSCERFLSLEEMDFEDTAFEDACVIIKGEVIIPKPTKIVKRFEL